MTEPAVDHLPFPESLGRRTVLRGGAASLLALLAGGCASPRPAAKQAGLPAFDSVPTAHGNEVIVPAGYRWQLLYPWGEPTGVAGAMPPWRPDASNGADDQALQAGMHHDGMHFFPIGEAGDRGLLVLNHEYTDETLLHTDGIGEPSAEKVRKSQHAVGVSVIELRLLDGRWEQVRPSPYARRIHARTPMRLAGPAAGHPRMRTNADPQGLQALGTYANCAMGVTPWGTYLTCEENFHGYFGAPRGAVRPDASQRRYRLNPDRPWVPWWRFDERFDMTREPNESNRFGWVVEIDPFDPTSTPVKRTALGRFCHESATCTVARDGRLVVYMGDDQRFEYVYKFVSRDPVRPGGYTANRELLDHGRLYVAKFEAGGRGQWLELAPGRNGIGAAEGFHHQGDVAIRTREAADLAGGTRMDRPEWIAVHPATGEVYVTLSNNSRRGTDGYPGADPVHLRAPDPHGQIVRWREAGGDASATEFTWDAFVLAGDPQDPRSGARYPSADAAPFSGPDGLHFDSSGLLWIQTDRDNAPALNASWQRLGNNALLCANPATGVIRRFLVGPRGCELTGCVLTPDRRTLFVNVQHPGERSESGGASGGWPDGGRPRSATLAVRRIDGGVIGS